MKAEHHKTWEVNLLNENCGPQVRFQRWNVEKEMLLAMELIMPWESGSSDTEGGLSLEVEAY